MRVRGVVRPGEALRHHHPPRVHDDLAGLDRVECRQGRVDPVEAQVRLPGQVEACIAADQGVALLLGEGEAHHGLVVGERGEHDPADAQRVRVRRLREPLLAARRRPHRPLPPDRGAGVRAAPHDAERRSARAEGVDGDARNRAVAAIMAAANAAARRGLLIRDGVALEKAGKIFLDQGLTGGYKDVQFEIEKLK